MNFTAGRWYTNKVSLPISDPIKESLEIISMGSGDKAFCTKHNLEILKINGKVNIGFQIPKEKKATRYTLS